MDALVVSPLPQNLVPTCNKSYTSDTPFIDSRSLLINAWWVQDGWQSAPSQVVAYEPLSCLSRRSFWERDIPRVHPQALYTLETVSWVKVVIYQYCTLVIPFDVEATVASAPPGVLADGFPHLALQESLQVRDLCTSLAHCSSAILHPGMAF